MPRMHRSRKGAIAKRVGARIEQLRDARGVSRARLAREAKISLTNLLLIERGEVAATIATLAAVAKVLHVPLAQIVGDDPLPPAPAANKKTFARLVDRLREKDDDYLRAASKLLDALDAITKR